MLMILIRYRYAILRFLISICISLGVIRINTSFCNNSYYNIGKCKYAEGTATFSSYQYGTTKVTLGFRPHTILLSTYTTIYNDKLGGTVRIGSDEPGNVYAVGRMNRGGIYSIDDDGFTLTATFGGYCSASTSYYAWG